MRGRLSVGYPAGAAAFFAYLAQRRDAGTYDDLAFR
jgi:hypothetical protein